MKQGAIFVQIAQLYVGLADAYLKVGDTKKSEEARIRAQACMEVSGLPLLCHE